MRNLEMYLLCIYIHTYILSPSLLQIEPNAKVKISHFNKWVFLYWNTIAEAQWESICSRVPDSGPSDFNKESRGLQVSPLRGCHWRIYRIFTKGGHRTDPFSLLLCVTVWVHILECLHLVYLKILFKNAKVHTVSLKQMSITLWSSRWKHFVGFFFFFKLLLLYINVTYSNNRRKILCPCVWIIKIGTSPD